MTQYPLQRTVYRASARRTAASMAKLLALAGCASQQRQAGPVAEVSIDRVPPLASSLAP
ncbi:MULTISPECIES: hypothetical protein [Achromobacter]|uniref:hypothetical protein n=1 Tax=Achromobacter TaxID=222 RepID=UPI0003D67BB0|nr:MULTISPECIES: hypothetical protein [Achromobacter]AHC47307.1 hypothetical protein AX27061_2845 [Achromobacter xylosoxidans NBRC 15126 = ATCC 27061]MCH1986305.1 hypothetical protein [Achromobacter xylosoxidans]MCH1998700.1 hypothetical protein [Achromobacter xylosoxidans]MCH4581026.1 hypothetical protein [Achromobacter xylosoxidans]MCH4588914.1 hypothetical protein [Achromobacter xylosoxidans]